MRLYHYLAILLAPITSMAGAATHHHLTSRQLEHLKPAERDRVVKHDLASILQTPRKITLGMFWEVRGASMSTRPAGTGYVGLCRRDEVVLWYRGDTTRTRIPYAVTATPRFHLLDIPSRAVAQVSPGHDPERTCARLPTGREDRWFEAKDADDAMAATSILEKAVALVRQGKIRIATCDHYVESGTCEEIMIRHADLENLTSIGFCDAADGQVCYALSFFGLTVNVTAQSPDEGHIPSEIRSVTTDTFVVVT